MHGSIANTAFQAIGAERASFSASAFEQDLLSQSPEAFETLASVTYSEEAIAELIYMIEEEKLAGDVYDVFFDLYGLKIFDNIAESEDSHFDALINQAEKLGIDVSVYLEEEVGVFTNDELQALFDALIEDGSQSVTDALEVGVLIEEKDLTDIAEAIEHVEDAPLADVYENLLDGSYNHLDAFEFALM